MRLLKKPKLHVRRTRTADFDESVGRPKYKRPRIPNAARRALARKYDCVPGHVTEIECYWCEETGKVYWSLNDDGSPHHWPVFGLDIDHLLPLSRGGTHDIDNLVFSCEFCNSSRSARTIDEFEKYLAKRLNS